MRQQAAIVAEDMQPGESEPSARTQSKRLTGAVVVDHPQQQQQQQQKQNQSANQQQQESQAKRRASSAASSIRAKRKGAQAANSDRQSTSLTGSSLSASTTTTTTTTTTATATTTTTNADEENKPIVCAACSKPIRERYLLEALDKQWHEDCLKCACCDCRLGEVGSSLYTQADKILCRRDFLRIFGQPGSCAACKKSIPPYELVMRANENAYHMECFACQQCQYRFCVGDRFHLTDLHRIICTLCHSDSLQLPLPVAPQQQQSVQMTDSSSSSSSSSSDPTTTTTTTTTTASIAMAVT